MNKYDIIIIGSGVGGNTAAYKLKDKFNKIAIIEDGPWGGTCPNRGCDPKKIFMAGVEVIEHNNQLINKGFKPLHNFDWEQLLAFKRSYTGPFSENLKHDLSAHGIDTIKGTAQFINDYQVQVGKETYEADKFIVATGERPYLPDIKGKEYMKTSTDFLEMEKLPREIIFVGAGYIAFELATIANAAGSEVTIIHHNDRPLKVFDSDMVGEMIKQFRNKGIRFIFNTEVKEIRNNHNDLEIIGNNFKEKTGCIFSAAGRIPNIEKLNLNAAGIKYDNHGIIVNEYLQTTNSLIYACGDVISKSIPKLTPVSVFEGFYLADNLSLSNRSSISYPQVPTIVYGSPKLASIGVKTDMAIQNPGKFKIKEMDVTSWFNYRRINEPIAKVKLIFEGDYLVGATTISSQADELINLLCLVIEKKITKNDIDKIIFGYPTIASDISNLM